VIGAVIGLGAAILIELGLGHYRERQGAD